MEGRIRSLFLILGLGAFSPFLYAAETKTTDEVLDQELKPVIQPEITRREFHESRIDTENFEVSGFFGLLSIEDFGTNPVYGARFAYHVTEELFVEGTIGQSQGGKTSFETLTGGSPILTDEERTFNYYNIAVGFNLLPGEVFPTRSITYNSDLYVLGGIGNTTFAGADRYTLNAGLGYRFYFTDYLTLRTDFRDHVYTIDIFGENKVAHNMELTFGLSFFF